MSNPFFYGPPVSPDQFVGREWEINHIVGRIVNQGQSTAVVGEPRTGKTSLLLYLSAPETRTKLYGEVKVRLLFSYLDAQRLGTECNRAEFWERALRPLREEIVASDPNSSLARTYEKCQQSGFGAFELEEYLVEQMRLAGLRLVLMLDEFDSLLHHPVLNSSDFFGDLRSLFSLSRGALALIIASRLPLEKLNEDTRQFSRASSPYFNVLSEVTLGPLQDEEVTTLLNRAGDRFTESDHRLIEDMAGGHPYLLQVVASALWDAGAKSEDSYQRRKQAGLHLYTQAGQTISETWRLWSHPMRKALTAVALHQMAEEGNRVHGKRLLRDLRDLGAELRSLEQQGFLIEDAAAPSGWRVRPQAFLWWLADEVVRTVRSSQPFDEWLQAQAWEGPLTRGEKQQLNKFARAIADLFEDGAKAFIEAAAKGAGAGISGG